MGRGNTCVHGQYEGLFYVDYDNFKCRLLDENDEPILDEYGEPQWDDELEQIQFDDWKEEFALLMKKRFPSFENCDLWLDREDHAILQNDLFFIVLTDNEWSVAVKLIQRESSIYSYHKNGGYYYISDNTGLQKKHYKNYLNGLQNVLFNFFYELGIYSGAWTSRTIKRPKDFNFL